MPTATKKSAAKKAAVKKTPAKKTAPKKAAPAKEKPSIHIKYEDKSAGQPELVAIFEQIKKMMEPYHGKRSLVLHTDKPSAANLVSHKAVVIEGRPRKELWVVSALVQKGYVGFYSMPFYSNSDIGKQFSEDFLKTLKGKSCYHIKQNTKQMMADIKKAIRIGYDEYVKRGWI